MKLYNNGGRIEGENAFTSQAEVVAVVGDVNNQTQRDTYLANLFCHAPEMKTALVACIAPLAKAIEQDAFAGCVNPQIGERALALVESVLNEVLSPLAKEKLPLLKQ